MAAESVLSRATSEAPSLPTRLVLYAGEGFGKTSFAAHAPEPLFLMTQGETGLLSLLEAGRVDPVDHIPDDFHDWNELLRAVKALGREDHAYKTLVLDTGNGAEVLCAAHVCREFFNNNWLDYQAYGKGHDRATKEWAEFLALLDRVRADRGLAVVILHHARVKTFADPAGKDYDQWRPEAIDKLWALTHKWADVILYGGFKVQVDRDDKARSESRYLRADASAAIVAKNRYGLPAEITAGAGADKLWGAFAKALKAAKAAGRPKPEAKAPAPTEVPAEAAPAREREAEPRATADEVQGFLSHLKQLNFTWPAAFALHFDKLGYAPQTCPKEPPAVTEFTAGQLRRLYAAIRDRAPAAAAARG